MNYTEREKREWQELNFQYKLWLSEWQQVQELNRGGDFSQGRAIRDASGNIKIQFEV